MNYTNDKIWRCLYGKKYFIMISSGKYNFFGEVKLRNLRLGPKKYFLLKIFFYFIRGESAALDHFSVYIFFWASRQ